MNWKERLFQPGVPAALGAALLFGAGTPLAKLLLNRVSPWLLAGLLYFGSGIGLTLYRRLSPGPAISLPRAQVRWLAGAIVAGGIVGPVLLMLGLRAMAASGASLLLNGESVFTALLAWFAFKENFDRRIALGMAAILAGAIVLSWQGEARFVGLWPTLAVLGACFAWGIDNNLTRKVSQSDATWIPSIKGLVAGSVNLTLAFALGAKWPPLVNLAGAMIVGFLAYGVSLALFVVGLRHLGTARTGAYFSVAPFFGATLALALGERMTLQLLIAGALMALGVWLHLTEQHSHWHTHEALSHDHEHIHYEHHQHLHGSPARTSGSQASALPRYSSSTRALSAANADDCNASCRYRVERVGVTPKICRIPQFPIDTEMADHPAPTKQVADKSNRARWFVAAVLGRIGKGLHCRHTPRAWFDSCESEVFLEPADSLSLGS